MYYTFGSEPTNVDEVGHFTQLVWKSSTELGVGMARPAKGGVVCNYNLPGNVTDQFGDNVLGAR